MNGNIKLCSQDKIKYKQKSIVQKKDEYNDIINKYLQKIADQRHKLLILREKGIGNYKVIKKLYINVETSLEVNGECGIIRTLNVKENKNTE